MAVVEMVGRVAPRRAGSRRRLEFAADPLPMRPGKNRAVPLVVMILFHNALGIQNQKCLEILQTIALAEIV